VEVVVEEEEEEEEEVAADDDVVECQICLDKIGSKKAGLPSGGVLGAYFLPCAHIFHKKCISLHFATQAKNKDSQRAAYRHASGKWCPVCKRTVSESDGEDDAERYECDTI
jgi:hypothetical protein